MNNDSRLDPVRWDAGAVASRFTVRAAIVLNVLLAAWYFTWLLDVGHASNTVLFTVLVVAELFNLVQGSMFWWTVWADQPRPPAPAWSGRLPDVDVFIPVYNEPLDIVAPTVAAATRMRGGRVTVWLLDDGGSDAMVALAARYGARYVHRTSRSGAKAGNINHALALATAPFVAVFDCDHVPDERFLEATLGHFGARDVAFVQTPQYYANAGQHPIAAAAAAQQELFFGVIARGKAARGSMFCCGTNVVFRREALDEVGGFPEDSLTEDFALSIELHERGWRSEYVAEVLASGLGPEDMASYVSQQRRWAQGCLGGVARVVRSRLSWRQRLQYLSSGTYFLSGWTVLIYATLPILRLVLGAQPIGAVGTDTFILHFAPYFVASVATVAVASGGAFNFNAFALSSATFGVHVRSTAQVLSRRRGRFVVTPKHGASSRQLRPVAASLTLVGALALAILIGLWREPSPSTLNNVAYAGLHLVVLSSGAWPAVVGRRLTRPDLRIVDTEGVAA